MVVHVQCGDDVQCLCVQVFVLPAIYGAVVMVMASHSDTHQLAATIYGAGLAGLFGISTFFHIVFYLGYYK